MNVWIFAMIFVVAFLLPVVGMAFKHQQRTKEQEIELERLRAKQDTGEVEETGPEALGVDVTTTRELKQTLQSLLDEHRSLRQEIHRLEERVAALEAGRPGANPPPSA